MTLCNTEPPASEDEIRAAADIAAATSALLGALVTSAPARDRRVAAARAHDRAARRFSAPRAALDPHQKEGTP
jgi:hypothetical protein